MPTGNLSLSYGFTFNELPKCGCDGKPSLAPVMDVDKDGVPYLKGWFCPSCKSFYCFAQGDMKIKKATAWEDRNRDR